MNDFLKYTFAGENGLFLVSRSLFRVFSRRFLRFLLGLGSGLLYLFLGNFRGILYQVDGLVDGDVLDNFLLRQHALDSGNVDAVVLGDLLVLGVDLLWGRGQVFYLSDLLEGQTDLDLSLSGLLEGLAEGLHVGTGVVQVEIQAHALGLQAVAEVVDHLVDLVVVHALRNVAFHVLDNGGDQAVFHVNLRLLVRFLLQFFLDVLLQVRQGVKLADILCKLVVQSRQLLLLNCVYLYLEDNRLTLEVLCMVIFREGDVQLELVASLVADNLLLKARDELAGAEGSFRPCRLRTQRRP